MIDVIVPIGQVILTGTLVPTLVQRVKLPLLTTLPAVAVLSSFAYAFADAGYVLSAVTATMSAVIWLLIMFFGKEVV